MCFVCGLQTGYAQKQVLRGGGVKQIGIWHVMKLFNRGGENISTVG
jgi:hypothetical protein